METQHFSITHYLPVITLDARFCGIAISFVQLILVERIMEQLILRQ